MPDISMCTGNGCPRSSTCYRKTAKPSRYMQTYFTNPPFEASDPTRCRYYMPIYEDER